MAVLAISFSKALLEKLRASLLTAFKSVVKAFKSYMQDASKVICVMQKMREDFVIAC